MAEIPIPARPASPAIPRARDYDPRAVWSWACYDFANSPFTTLVVTFIFSTYFTQVIASDPVRGTTLWSWGGVTASAASSPPPSTASRRWRSWSSASC